MELYKLVEPGFGGSCDIPGAQSPSADIEFFAKNLLDRTEGAVAQFHREVVAACLVDEHEHIPGGLAWRLSGAECVSRAQSGQTQDIEYAAAYAVRTQDPWHQQIYRR